MTLAELKEVVDRLVAEGHGEVPVICTPENFNPGYRMGCFAANIRQARLQGDGYWIYNLRDEPTVTVFELSYAGIIIR
jgi:endonuclease YncB( thermonuclease family)